MIIQVTPIIDYSVRGLCCKPYQGHPKGCPNFNHKEGCPPEVAKFDEVFDLSKPIYTIYNRFDLKSHVEKMRTIHPGWSKSQLHCCLYWQTTARKNLTEKLINFLKDFPEYHVAVAKYSGAPVNERIIWSPPEAMSVNLTDTMANAGIELEWPPENVTYQIALAGIKK